MYAIMYANTVRLTPPKSTSSFSSPVYDRNEPRNEPAYIVRVRQYCIVLLRVQVYQQKRS